MDTPIETLSFEDALKDLERMFAVRDLTPESSKRSVIADFQETRPLGIP